MDTYAQTQRSYRGTDQKQRCLKRVQHTVDTTKFILGYRMYLFETVTAVTYLYFILPCYSMIK